MKLIEKILMPAFEWIQIEVSGLCNASCFYCPHTLYRKDWKGRNLTLYEFARIVPYLKKVKLLYLQGWGEPFLNPDFFEFVKIAKKSGCMVGTTTNGMVIEKNNLEKIIDLNIDFIAFSFAGINKNDTMRMGTKIEKILKIIENLKELKIKKGTNIPKIHIAYMLLKSNFDELEKIPEFFSNTGIDHIIISLLDFIPEPSFAKESLVPKTEDEFDLLKEKAVKIIEDGKRLKLPISFNLPHPYKKGKTCSEKVLNSLFINSLGNVSPCVFTGIPSKNVNNLVFGNIKDKSFPLIWKSPEYKKFRGDYISDNPPHPCSVCPKFRIIELS